VHAQLAPVCGDELLEGVLVPCLRGGQRAYPAHPDTAGPACSPSLKVPMKPSFKMPTCGAGSWAGRADVVGVLAA
jgi:hypothetical protein